MLKYFQNNLGRIKKLRYNIIQNFTIANIELVTSKKNAMLSAANKTQQDSEVDGPKYLKFFKAADEMLYDELVHYDINQTSFYVARNLSSDMFTFSSKLRNIRLLNQDAKLEVGLWNKLWELKGKVHMDIEAFAAFHLFLLKSGKIKSSLVENVINYNQYLLDNFSEYSLIRQIDILMVMNFVQRHNEDLVQKVIVELKKKISNDEIWNELNFYWDYLTLIHFLSNYLTTYIKEADIRECYNQKFLNRLLEEINTKFGDLRHMSKILEFTTHLIAKSQVNYLMYQFLRTMFFQQ